MSVRTQSGTSLTVKKTRAPAAKKEAPKTTRTVKKPTAPAKPSPPPQSQPSQAPQRKPSPAAASEDDMDKLTAGMKKVKINLITKTQKEERAKAAQAAQAKAAIPSATEEAKPAFPAQVATPTAPSPVAPPTVTPPQEEAFTTPPTQPPAFEDLSLAAAPSGWPEVSTPVTEQMPVAVTPDPRQLELPVSSPVTSPAVATPSDSDVFINYQPDGPTPVSMTPQEPLKWLPPNMNTPVKTSPSKLSSAKLSPNKKSPAKMMRADLPVFTSTSAIPFAPQDPHGMLEVKQEAAVKADPEEPAKSIWEIPETPQK
ncbi:uncharacterized protein ColSpa_07496 [Colletotrichum spaethianum]|uniref:Uncharacterized protein n=1 Tax=Colletotrichum spaethianum TaxID=700344 RepID=A0AA37P1X4_9PEZI|nr:uncharacterized protein ColSpa_07496 [Colletotrichum spaethianum]GKT47315.1 hypothetical protein ColSpa_07496 [Colletotrichum spaethianum]